MIKKIISMILILTTMISLGVSSAEYDHSYTTSLSIPMVASSSYIDAASNCDVVAQNQENAKSVSSNPTYKKEVLADSKACVDNKNGSIVAKAMSTEVVKEEEPEVEQHNYVPISKLEPTCFDNGYLIEMCTSCFDARKTVLNALGHDFGEFVTTIEPDCTTNGLKTKVCSRCGSQEFEELEALGHDFVLKSSEVADLIGNVRKTYCCSRCKRRTSELETKSFTKEEYLNALNTNISNWDIIDDGEDGVYLFINDDQRIWDEDHYDFDYENVFFKQIFANGLDSCEVIEVSASEVKAGDIVYNSEYNNIWAIFTEDSFFSEHGYYVGKTIGTCRMLGGEYIGRRIFSHHYVDCSSVTTNDNYIFYRPKYCD